MVERAAGGGRAAGGRRTRGGLEEEYHEAEAGEEGEEEGAHDEEREHGVEGAAVARPDTAEVQDEQRKRQHEQVVPNAENAQ